MINDELKQEISKQLIIYNKAKIVKEEKIKTASIEYKKLLKLRAKLSKYNMSIDENKLEKEMKLLNDKQSLELMLNNELNIDAIKKHIKEKISENFILENIPNFKNCLIDAISIYNPMMVGRTVSLIKHIQGMKIKNIAIEQNISETAVRYNIKASDKLLTHYKVLQKIGLTRVSW